MAFSIRRGVIWLLIMGILISSTLVMGQADKEYGVQPGTTTEWEITSIFPGPKVWLGLDLIPKATWSATNGSTVVFVVTSISGDGELFGDLTIDEFSLEKVSSEEAGLNFALGFYPGIPGILTSWIPGLITDLDFVSHELNARAQAALLDGSFQADEPVSDFLGKQLKVVIYTISQVGQNATLTYDKKSGILLAANTGFGDFFISLSISSTTHPLEEATPIPFPGVIVLCALSFLALWKRRIPKQ